jgi:hypothetical protein
LSEQLECVSSIKSCFGGALDEGDLILLGKVNGLIEGNLASILNCRILIIFIAFVTDEHYFDVLVGGEVLGLLQPLGCVLKRGEGRYIID